MLPVSLDCPFLLPIRYSLTFICPVSCVHYVASFSGLSFFSPLRYSLTFICPVSCVPYVSSFSRLSFFITRSVFSNIYLFCVLCTLCYQFLWIILFYCPFGILKHVCVLCLVYPMLPVSGLFFLIAPSVFSNIYLSCFLYTLCCQFLWIVLFFLPLRYSLTFICPVSCAPYVTSFSGLYFFIAPSVFSNIYLSCVLYTLCCQFLWIVLFYCPFGILKHVFVLCLVFPILPVSG
jgi:hypothetical protein